MVTLRGRVLLGWMSREEGVNFLINDCEFNPPINVAEAENIWRDYRHRAEALPERPLIMPNRLGLSVQEIAHIQRFRKFVNSFGPNSIIDVAKINILELRIIQYYIATERSEIYRQATPHHNNWIGETLPTSIHPTQIRFTGQQTGMNTSYTIEIPHAEHVFSCDAAGKFSASQLLRHVTIMENGGCAYLTAGYHRCFAICFSVPTATVPSAVVAVAVNTLTTPPATSNAALGVTDSDLGPYGTRAAIFADFFTDDLFMEVNLRKKRYQIQVQATWNAIDDQT